MTRKRSSEFSRENVEIFWWSTNRDKICQVVRESEKVENLIRNYGIKARHIKLLFLGIYSLCMYLYSVVRG